MKRISVLLMLVIGVVYADMSLKSDKVYQPYQKIVLEAKQVSSPKAQFLWDITGEAEVEEVGSKLYVWAKPGVYTVTLTAIDFETKKIERSRTSFRVVDPTPPVPPTPPDPPVPPTPPPTPPPIPGDGLRVLILYESEDLSKLKPEQHAIIYGKPLRDYLNSVCAAGPDGKTKEWRIFDKDVDVSGEVKTWQDAMANAKKDPKFSTPWILVSNGKNGYSGPLPGSATSTEELVKKYVSLKKAG